MRIKIACPYNVVTGGIELLHQVANELNTYDEVLAEIWYINDPHKIDIPNEYLVYNNTVNNTVHFGDILLFPEIWADYTNRPEFRDYKKIVYWESVDNYFGHTPKENWFKFKNDVIHISQSYYSDIFLHDVLKVSDSNIIEITDYVNKDFLNCDLTKERQPIVLYNPVKGFEFTEKLIQYAKDITFQPISGMTRKQILDKMTQSMVFVDFGNFPGKDRLPREAGACGMCLVTGKNGASRYFEDLPIPESCKFNNVNYSDLEFIVNKIRDILENFQKYQSGFKEFRDRLKQEEELFKAGINMLIYKLQE